MSEPGNNGSMWHFFLCVKDKNAKAVRREACHTFPSLERERGGWWKKGKQKNVTCGPFYKNIPPTAYL